MATHKGSEGTVKVGTNAVAEIRSYSLEESSDTLEDTSMGDSARTYKPSLTSFSGSLDVFWDETDTSGQGALSIGSEVQLLLLEFQEVHHLMDWLKLVFQYRAMVL